MEKIRILIVDDHPVVRRGVQELLETHEGWEVCGQAATGGEAVEQVERLKPDVVIMDISMPEMNGLEAIRHMCAAAPGIEILTLTMHDSESMFRGAMEAGAHGYVLKSDLDGRLIEAVEALSEHRAFFSPSVSQAILNSFFETKGRTHLGAEDAGVLTPRQRQIIVLLAHGKSNKEVASALGISTRTAETHRYNIMARLKVQTLSELVLFAVRNRLVEP